MLTTPEVTRGRLVTVAIALLALVAGGLAAIVALPAAAEGTCPTVHEDGSITYENCHGGGNGPGDVNGGNEGGGNDDPSCEFYGEYDEFCDGLAACWGNNPAANDPEDLSPDENPGPPPSEDAVLAYKSCRNPDGSTYDDWYWSETTQRPPWHVLARRAKGALSAPAFDLSFQPNQITYVGTETYFWAEGPDKGELTGSSAFGLVAIATPNRVEVDPGDGSKTLNCGWSVQKTAKCVRTYAEASSGQSDGTSGQPAYTARARLVYDVRYEVNGAPLGAQLPADLYTLESAWDETPVPVGEVQVIVE